MFWGPFNTVFFQWLFRDSWKRSLHAEILQLIMHYFQLQIFIPEAKDCEIVQFPQTFLTNGFGLTYWCLDIRMTFENKLSVVEDWIDVSWVSLSDVTIGVPSR